MSYDDDPRNDYTLCDDPGCAGCNSERVRRAARDAARETPPAPSPMLREDGTLPVPAAFDAGALLTALDGNGTVTLTRDDARRVVATLATRRAPDDAATIESLRTRVREAQEAHRRDIATIGAALMSEAEDRDWCGIYDSVVEQLNSELSVTLPLRARDVTIYLSDEEGTNHFYVTVKIDGDEDEGDAARQVLDLLRGSVNDWGYA